MSDRHGFHSHGDHSARPNRLGRTLVMIIEPAREGAPPPPASIFEEAVNLALPILKVGGTGGEHDIHHDPAGGRSNDPTYHDYHVTWTIKQSHTFREGPTPRAAPGRDERREDPY